MAHRFEGVRGVIHERNCLRAEGASIIHLRDDGGHCGFTKGYESIENPLLLIAADPTKSGDECAHLRETRQSSVGAPRCDYQRLPGRLGTRSGHRQVSCALQGVWRVAREI